MTHSPEITAEMIEAVARAMIEEVERQTDGRWPYDGDDGLCILIDDHIDFVKLARAAIQALGKA